MKTIRIKDDFSEYPGLRHASISEMSGEQFYHEILNKEFYNAQNGCYKLIIDIDDTDGFASSFLDEAFGNLVYDFTLDKVKITIEVISTEEPHWKEMIYEKTFNEWENRRKKKHEPKVTKIHESWYRFSDNVIEKKVWNRPEIDE